MGTKLIHFLPLKWIAKSHTGPSVNSEARIEGLSKCSPNFVDEIHWVCDAVKCQNPCREIDINANPVSPLHFGNLSFLSTVPEWVGILKAHQTPRLGVVSKCTLGTLSFPANILIGHCDVHRTLPAPLGLEVTTAGHALSAQNLAIVIKPLWVVRNGQRCFDERHLSTLWANAEVSVSGVQV